MSTNRRTILAGLAGLGATMAAPAWAQAIGAQSDPWAQVDPYADARNGFPTGPAAGGGSVPQTPLSNDLRHAALSPADEEEVAVGRYYYDARLKRDGGANPNPRLQKALRDFCQPLFAKADRAHLPWIVTLVDNPSPNASAGPGGTVVVRSSIVSIFDHPCEFASILAHEVGHVDCHHLTRGISGFIQHLRENGQNPLSNADLATLMPQAQGGVKDYLDLVEKAYSRGDEAEADAHVMVMFERLGVDPKHAANGMRVVLKLEQSHGGGAANEWVTDHPLTPDRIRDLEQRSGMQRKPAKDFVFPGWDVLKAAFPTPPAFRKA